MRYTQVFRKTKTVHFAQIYRRNKLLVEARNTIGSRSKGSGYNDRSLHAELAVVKRLGDISQLRGCVLVVMRINRDGDVMNSEPCGACKTFLEKCIKQYGLLRYEHT
jgi:hypothetical protein